MRIVFMGTPQPATAALQELLNAGHDVAAVYTQPDRPAGRGQKVAGSPVKELALNHGLAVVQPAKIKSEAALKEFSSHSADVAVVVAYGRILPAGFLNAYPFGAINVHFSLLPKYRGAAPVNWALANGETVTGVTTMKMDEGLDTGPILLQEEVAIGKLETAPELMARLADFGAKLLIKTLDELDRIEPTEQLENEASYAPILSKADGCIAWALSATVIGDRVRGFKPFPGSFTFLNGVRTVIWSARPSDNAILVPAAPGTIVSVTDGVIEVAAGKGTVLLIEELQFEGKRRIAATDAVNSGQIRAGLRFTDQG